MRTLRVAVAAAAVTLALVAHTTADEAAEDKNMRIVIEAGGKTVVFSLNQSAASKDLLDQLPLSVKLDDFGGKEKIFYPPKKLRTDGTPLANAKAGTLAYYAPWGDVVLFYEDFGTAAGLYELGKVVSGAESIGAMKGSARVSVSRMEEES